MHALGPKAEGTELKIAGWLWWPPARARPPHPHQPRDSCSSPGPAQDILGTLSPLLTLGIPRQRLQGGQTWGQGDRGQGWCEGWPPPRGQRVSTEGWGPWPSCPDLFSPTGSKHRTSGWGSKSAPNPGPLLPSPTWGVSVAPPAPSGHLHLSATPSHGPIHVPNLSLLFPPPSRPLPGTVRR